MFKLMLFLTIAITGMNWLCEGSFLLVKLKTNDDEVNKEQEIAKKVKGHRHLAGYPYPPIPHQQYPLLGCPPTYPIRSITGKCYFRSSNTKSWHGAIRSCAMQGGKLAEPTNAQEHQALAGKKYDWLGLTKSGSWTYASSNLPAVYLPSSILNNNGNNNCMMTYNSHKWYAYPCQYSYPYWCEYVPPPPPPPTTKKPSYGYNYYYYNYKY